MMPDYWSDSAGLNQPKHLISDGKSLSFGRNGSHLCDELHSDLCFVVETCTPVVPFNIKDFNCFSSQVGILER